MNISSTELPSFSEELDLLHHIGKEAGRIAMSYFGKEPEVWMKPGDSPVSEGDLAVNTFLEKELRGLRPDYGWLSEETIDSTERLARKRTFIVDPIDGTRAYIAGRETWCVSIALVEDGRPIAGILECPVLEETFLAGKGAGAKVNGSPIRNSEFTHAMPIAGPVAMRNAMSELSVSEYALYAEHIPSLAYRLAMVAKGDLSAAFARPRSHDWDIAAADLILEEVGASLWDVTANQATSAPLYNQRNLKRGVLMAGSKSAPDVLLDVAKRMANSQ